MPYKSMDEANKAIKGIEPAVSLEQANLIASWADKITAAGSADSPWGAAIANFKKSHTVEDGKWVRNKKLEAYEDGDDLFVIVAEIELEKVTKSEGKQYPASDYLVAEDPEKPTTWHLRITKSPGGPPDHAQCGAAWAALHEGYRGNKYQGPNKAEAIKKLTAIYHKNKWPLPTEAEDTTLRYFGLLELDEAQTPAFARNRNPDGTPKWIPLHREGEWDHPQYGHFTMTEEKMEQAKANFYGLVHRPDSPIDGQVPVDTRHQGDPASGWLLEMRIDKPYLWGKPGWTDKGKQTVLDKEYRYISPRYLDDPQKGPIFQEITLTNRDFLKMPPVDGAGPNIFLSDDEPAVVIQRSSEHEEVTDVEKFKLTIGGEEKELSLEEVQELISTGELTAKELADVKVELEKAKKPQETPREAITLTQEDGTEVVLTASAVAGLLHDNETYRKNRKDRDVRDALKELEEKNVEPIVVQMMEPILNALNPEAQGLIQLEAGPVAKAFGFVDAEGNATEGQMNLWMALTRLIQQIPARSNDPRSLLAESRRPKNTMPSAAEMEQYDPNAISMEEIEKAEQWAAEQYTKAGKKPRIALANQE